MFRPSLCFWPLLWFLSVLFTASLFVGCAEKPHNPQLIHAASIVSEHPTTASATLDNIDVSALSESDRHFYDLLTIKVNDKLYIRHISDSLILNVIDYYSNHGPKADYLEALYYGGRVYSDLGDLPTALRYFQQAIDLLPPNTDREKLPLPAHLFSQTGRLLNSLRLYDQAASYMQKAIQSDSIGCDTLGWMFDTQSLGTIKMRSKKYHEAKDLFFKARTLARTLPGDETHRADIYLAAINYHLGDIDSARVLIQAGLRAPHILDREYALFYACEIYLAAGIPDTAYLYAHELEARKHAVNRGAAFHVLLSPRVREYFPSDSLFRYVASYRALMEASLDSNETREALLQNALYNYSRHERERTKAEQIKDQLRVWLYVTLSLLLAMAAIILWLKYKNTIVLLRLHQSISVIESLRNTCASTPPLPGDTSQPKIELENLKGLRDCFLQEVETLLSSQNGANLPALSPSLLNSKVYAHLQTYLQQQSVIPDKSPFWTELELTISESYPQFKKRLLLFAGGTLKDVDNRMALLIKCGCSPTQIALLVGRTKSTISYRREMLSVKIFGRKIESRLIDQLISYL